MYIPVIIPRTEMDIDPVFIALAILLAVSIGALIGYVLERWFV